MSDLPYAGYVRVRIIGDWNTLVFHSNNLDLVTHQNSKTCENMYIKGWLDLSQNE